MKSTSPSPSEGGERGGPCEERAAGFVVFCGKGDDRRYLLLRHQSEEYWAFPKGKIEPGEDDLAAAVREVFEETNIDQLQPTPGFRETSQYRFRRDGRMIAKRVAYFLGETSEDDVSLSAEHSDFRWLGFDEALSVLTYDESRRILREADRRLRLANSKRDQNDMS